MEIVTFIIDCLKSLWELLKNPITKRVEKANNKKKNIHIVFTTFNSENSISLDFKKSTPIDFMSWKEKIESGGNIVITFEHVNEIKKFLKKKNISEKTCKECYEEIRRVERMGAIMKSMIEKALLAEKVSCRIQEFSIFVESTANKCFPPLKSNDNDAIILKVYNNTHNSKLFSFEISGEEYNNVLEKSEGKIAIPFYVYFSEFMNYLSDKSILEREIIPEYLKSIARDEIATGKEIVIEDFYNWWISI